MIKYLIASPTQCGSTRLFNLIRLIHEELGHTVLSCWNWSDGDDNKQKYDVVISKIHDINTTKMNLEETIILLPYRDLRDTVISAQIRWPDLFNTFDKLIQRCHVNINFFNDTLQYQYNLVLCKYEEYTLDQVTYICKKIKIDISEDKLKIIMKEIDDMHKSDTIIKVDNKKDETFNKTLLSQAHNTSNGKSKKYLTYFTKEENENLLKDNKIYNWLKEYNYIK
jgi:hypothetical protein